VYTLGEPGVHAGDLPKQFDLRSIDQERYRVLLFRAAGTVLQPFGVQEQELKTQVIAHAMDVTFFSPVHLNA
jgi:hypothetical protein